MNIKSFPANIYKIYQAYSEEKDYSRKLQLMFDVYNQIITFFGCVFLSEYLYGEDVNEALNESIIGLARPSLGTWLSFIREYAKYSIKKGDVFITEFCDCYKEIYGNKNYEMPYSGRFRSESKKHENALDEIIMLRNQIAHGAMAPSVEEAKELIEAYDGLLTVILEGFNPVFESYAVAKAVEVSEASLAEYTAYFDIIKYDEKKNERYPVEFSEDDDYMGNKAVEYIKEDDMYLLSLKDNRLLRFAEYLVDIINDSEHEDYYLYDGYGNKSVTYIGMKYKKQIADYLDMIKTKLAEKGASTHWKKKVFDFESFSGYINDLSKICVQVHVKSGKYNPSVYISRECDSLLDDFIDSDKTTMIVTAEAGVGKTNYLCHSVQKLTGAGAAVYFYNGQTLTDTESSSLLFGKLQKECLDDKDFRTVSDFLKYLDEKNSEGKKFVLIVDAANEAYNMHAVLQEIDEISMLGENYPWLKIIVSIRTVSYQLLLDQISDKYGKKLPFLTCKDRYYSITKDNETRYQVKIEEWNVLQVIDAFEKYREDRGLDREKLSYHSLGREMQELLCNPLNMSLFFNVQSRRPNAVIDSEEALFSTMEETRGEESVVTKSMLSVQNEIVRQMIKDRRNEVDSDIAHTIDDGFTGKDVKDIRLLILSPLERLMDEGIMYEKNENDIFLVSFVYQKYLEYLLLKEMKGEGIEPEKAAVRLLESLNWNSLPEMNIACLKYLQGLDDLSKTAEMLMSTADSMNIDIQTLQTPVLELWYKAVLKGHIDETAKQIFSRNLLDWALCLLKRLNEAEESDASIGLIKALIENYSDDTELLFLRGLYYMKVSKFDSAVKDFKQCIEKGGEKMALQASVQLAKTYRKYGKVSEAKEVLAGFLKESDESTPYYADALIQLGLCKRSDKDYRGALQDYETALEITEAKKDNYVSIYNMLGISTVKADLGDIDGCEEVLLQVYKRAETCGYTDLLADSLNGLSANFVRKKKYKEALNYAREGLVIWRHSRYYTGQMVMLCTIMKAMHGLSEPMEKILEIKEEAESLLPIIKERVIIEEYEEAIAGIER